MAEIGKTVAAVAGAAAREVGDFGKDLVADMGGTKSIDNTNLTTEQRENLFDHVSCALVASVMTYGLADFRCLMRSKQHELKGDSEEIRKFLELPCPDFIIMKILSQNMDLLEANFKREELQMYGTAIHQYGKQIEEFLCTDANSPQRASLFREIQQRSVDLHVFDDVNSERELVYCISVNRRDKEIGVAFRGSVTVRDWQIDSQVFIREYDNPMYGLKKTKIPQTKRVGIHQGFFEYLMRKDRHGDETTTSKYETIMAHIRRLLQQHPGYTIRTMGHSLGAALATLFAFLIAGESDIAKPINCITFASPRVGNTQFLRAFQEHELRHEIVCLRIANFRDIVTLHPDRLSVCSFLFQDAIFRHVGIELLLYLEKEVRAAFLDGSSREDTSRAYRLRYVRAHRSRLRQLGDDFVRSFLNTLSQVASVTCGCCSEDYLRWHSCDEYMSRLQRASKSLDKMSTTKVVTEYRTEVAEQSEELLVIRPNSSSE